MSFTVQSLLFATYTGAAFALSLFAAVSALLQTGPLEKKKQLDRRHIALLVTTGVLTPPIVTACAIGSLPGYGFLLPLSPLLPLLAVCALVANATQMRDRGMGTRILLGATMAWNGALACIYTLRCLQVLFHIDVGPFGSGLLAAFAFTQTNVGSSIAVALPVFLYAPILLPTNRRIDSIVFPAVGGFLASFLLFLLGASIPGAYSTSKARREVVTWKGFEAKTDIHIAMATGDPNWPKRPDVPAATRVIGNTPSWQERIERATQIGLQRLELPVAADVVTDEDRFARLTRVVRQIRRAGLRINVVVHSPASNGVLVHHQNYQRLMLDAHWVIAERLKPDLLVLFSRPFQKDTMRVVGDLSVTRWTKMVGTSIEQLAEGHPEQRTAIDIQPPGQKAEAFFVEVSALGKGPDEIRFAVDGNAVATQTLARTEIELAGWLANHPTHKRIALVASLPTPLSSGGAPAQASFLKRLFSFAVNQPLVAGICVGSMHDSSKGLNGFWDSRDRQRPVATMLYDLLLQIRGVDIPSK